MCHGVCTNISHAQRCLEQAWISTIRAVGYQSNGVRKLLCYALIISIMRFDCRKQNELIFIQRHHWQKVKENIMWKTYYVIGNDKFTPLVFVFKSTHNLSESFYKNTFKKITRIVSVLGQLIHGIMPRILNACFWVRCE